LIDREGWVSFETIGMEKVWKVSTGKNEDEFDPKNITLTDPSPSIVV